MAKRPVFNPSTLQVAKNDILIPKENWLKWQKVFEHKSPATNSLLNDPNTFRDFVVEYSVARTIRKGTIDELRATLASDSTLAFLSDPSGKELDKADIKLRRRFGTMEGRRGIRSMLSKVAAFLAPDDFIAFDQYALRGVRRVRRHRVNELKEQGAAIPDTLREKIESYADYLRSMNELLDGPLGTQIKKACAGHYPSDAAAKKNRFHRRVLDIYLSRLGDREF